MVPWIVRFERSQKSSVCGLRLQIGASDNDRTVIFKPALINQLGGDFPDAGPLSSEGRQRIVVKCVEMIGQRFDGNAAIDAFLVDDGTEPHYLAPVVVVPFVGVKLYIQVILPVSPGDRDIGQFIL